MEKQSLLWSEGSAQLIIHSLTVATVNPQFPLFSTLQYLLSGLHTRQESIYSIELYNYSCWKMQTELITHSSIFSVLIVLG